MALPLSDLLLFGSGEKKLAACLLLLLLELFIEGESNNIYITIILYFLLLHLLMFKYTSLQPGAEASSTNQDINNHLELGKDFLARGQLSDALTHYHAAVGKCLKG